MVPLAGAFTMKAMPLFSVKFPDLRGMVFSVSNPSPDVVMVNLSPLVLPVILRLMIVEPAFLVTYHLMFDRLR